MSLELFVCVPRSKAAAPGEVLDFPHPQHFHRNPTSFKAAELIGRLEVPLEEFLADEELQHQPGTHVVLQVEGLAYDTDDPDFDPYRNWLTGLTSAAVVREVPVREVVRA